MSETSNFRFAVPEYGAKPWAHLMQACIQQIDTALAAEHKYAGGSAKHANVTCDSIALNQVNAECKKGNIADLGWFRRADRLNNNSYEPYTCSTKGFLGNQDLEDGSTTIEWTTDFGVPAGVKAVVLRVQTQQSDANTVPDRMGYVRFKMSEAATFYEYWHQHPMWKDVAGQSQGIVAIPTGSTFCEWRSPKAGTKMKVYIWVIGIIV